MCAVCSKDGTYDAQRFGDWTSAVHLIRQNELVCAQHREELSRAKDWQARAKQTHLELHDLRAAGPAETKPYSILLLDDILDQRDAERSRRQALDAELTAAEPEIRRIPRDRAALRRSTRVRELHLGERPPTRYH